ncbi:MAG: hypothetical protein ACFFA6_08495 [Promethearchaeota archaeon]
MKKMLFVILIAFVFISILTITITFQTGSTFRNFADDDDDDDDDNDDNIDGLSIVGFVEKRDGNAIQITISIDQTKHCIYYYINSYQHYNCIHCDINN